MTSSFNASSERRAGFPDYPFHGHELTVEGFRLHYLDEGPPDAPTVIMLHGNPTWSFYYRHLVLALRDRFRVIVPDHIGMGLSEKPAARRYPYTLARRVEDLTSLIDHLAPRGDLTLVLHDWGGMIGAAYAVRHAERIGKLVILNTAAFRLPVATRVPWQLRVVRTPVVGAFLVRGGNAFCRGAARDCTVRPLAPEVRDAYLAPYNNWHNRVAVLRFVEDIPLGPAHPSYSTVSETEARLPTLSRVPMFIGWGMRDFVFDAAYLDQWRRRFPQAELHRYDDAGHYVLEDARDELIPAIAGFLDSARTTGDAPGEEVGHPRAGKVSSSTRQP